jgi:hypothetical protein
MAKWGMTWLSAALLFPAITMVMVQAVPARAADNLKLNQHLDYTSDSHDGMVIVSKMGRSPASRRTRFFTAKPVSIPNGRRVEPSNFTKSTKAKCSLSWSISTARSPLPRRNW